LRDIGKWTDSETLSNTLIMSSEKKNIQIGRKLCFILRHDIINAGLECDSSGYVRVSIEELYIIVL